MNCAQKVFSLWNRFSSGVYSGICIKDVERATSVTFHHHSSQFPFGLISNNFSSGWLFVPVWLPIFSSLESIQNAPNSKRPMPTQKSTHNEINPLIYSRAKGSCRKRGGLSYSHHSMQFLLFGAWKIAAIQSFSLVMDFLSSTLHYKRFIQFHFFVRL